MRKCERCEEKLSPCTPRNSHFYNRCSDTSTTGPTCDATVDQRPAKTILSASRGYSRKSSDGRASLVTSLRSYSTPKSSLFDYLPFYNTITNRPCSSLFASTSTSWACHYTYCLQLVKTAVLFVFLFRLE